MVQSLQEGESRPWRIGRTEWKPGGFMNAWQFCWSEDSRYLLYLYDVVADAWYVSGSPTREERQNEFPGLPDFWLSLREMSATNGARFEIAALAPGEETRGSVPSEQWFAFSPDGEKVVLEVWRGRGKERRAGLALWNLKTGELQPITDFPGEAGLRLARYDNEFAWQGDRIYFVCENQARRVPPNPAPNQGTMPAREIWSVRADGGDLRRETEGPEDAYPAPRPGTREIAFIRKGSICLRRADGEVVTLVERWGRGKCTGPVTWSPDGKQIAFTWRGSILGGPGIWAARVVDAPVHP